MGNFILHAVDPAMGQAYVYYYDFAPPVCKGTSIFELIFDDNFSF